MSTATKVRLKKELVGVVVSDKMDKTVIVRADRRMIHAQYDKVILVSKKFVAHDEKNEAKIGDVVRINQSRPLSKTKRWVVVGTVSKNTRADHHSAKKSEAESKANKAKSTKSVKAAKAATKRKSK